MQLTGIEAVDFLSFSKFSVAVQPGLTVVTGPNGVGKTNLGRCLELARAVLARSAGDREGQALDLFASAGHGGASAFQVSLALDFNQPWERDLILTYVRAAYACSGLLNDREVQRQTETLDRVGRARIVEESLQPLWSGTLRIAYDAAMRSPFFAAWEFDHGTNTYHLVLDGQGVGQLSYGRADIRGRLATSNMNLTVALTSSIGSINVDDPGEADPARPPLDLANILPTPDQAITTNISSPTDASAPIPLSLRELGRLLGVASVEQKHFEFGRVFWEILRRQIVLTDNRRVPFERRFTRKIFDWPINVRDGRDLPAELFRLKNGDHGERQRFSMIQAMFQALTQRRLDLRSFVEPSHVSDDGLIIEPVVITDAGEIPIQFAGAGAQEALILSALVPGEPGQILVLDEPAVNVEPTMQRRLTQLLPTGQCLIITHSPDLVVIDRPDDLGNIIRLAPRAAGPQPMRANVSDMAGWARWFKLLEPSHVRALLFASRVILCEGQTEVGALRQWWRNTESLGLPSPEAANIPIISVDGDTSFGTFIEYLDAFGVPWAAIADGPALRSNSHLARQLTKLGRLPSRPTPSAMEFSVWRNYWEDAGVFTVATEFGDDTSRSGEFEAYLDRTDPALLATIRAEVGQRSKPQVGTLFAAQHPPPHEVTQLYQKIMTRWSQHATTNPPTARQGS